MQTVILNDQEATSFLKWRQFQDNFDVLLAHGVFEIKNGSAELHFDREGNIDSVSAHLKLYKRNKLIHVTVLESKQHEG